MSFQPAPIVWKIHLVIQFTNATAQYPRTLVAFLYQYSTICAHNTLRTSFESKTFWDFFFSPLWHVLCAHLLLMLKRVLFYSFLFFFCWIGMRCMVLFLIDVAVCFAMIPGTHGHIWNKKPFFFPVSLPFSPAVILVFAFIFLWSGFVFWWRVLMKLEIKGWSCQTYFLLFFISSLFPQG